MIVPDDETEAENSSYRKEDTTLAFTCWIHINGWASQGIMVP